jgi:asparagine synthase (glutamine-hydrolysing)
MSGFVGILNLDGAPVDQVLLERMTRSLAFRGPDAEGVWCGETVGLGHTLLRTTLKLELETKSKTENDEQPATLSGLLWIVADARIDGRAELIKKLKAKSGAACGVSLSTPDAMLILHAYNVWGDACVEHLIGDFSLAIWDAGNRKLFCARDQFGVKPFYYARVGSCLVFSNTLNCIRRHPAVSSRLNDLAIADFLLFDMHQGPEATSFTDIQRLPPAHAMSCERGKICVRRYWVLPEATLLQYRRKEEYLDRFRELLDTAVVDRLRTDSAGVLMSGGLDSPIVAATARRHLSGNGKVAGLRAYTDVFDRLIPHEERHYATLVADALKIPIQYLVIDHRRIFEGADQPEFHSPEPTHTAWPDQTADQLSQLAASSRVALTGFGGDPALCGRVSVHLRQLIEGKQFGRALADAARYLMVEGRISRLYLRTRWRILFASKSETPAYPGWLNEDLEKRLGLRDRWESISQVVPAPTSARPEAHEAMVAPLWANLFEDYDTGLTRVAVEVRHPFFDLRLVNFLLALPRLPWCCDKQLLREATLGVLPDAVRLRRKSPLSVDPLIALLQKPESAWVDRFDSFPELDHYIARNRIPAVHREKDSWMAWIHLRPLSLMYWLRQAGFVN